MAVRLFMAGNLAIQYTINQRSFVRAEKFYQEINGTG
jgi:hypothetical protein